MVTIKRLSQCTFEQGLKAWNEGFQGYFSDMTFTLDRYTKKLGAEGLSPELSVVAFDGEEPIGFILNGIRTINGKKVSWNGGTGVAPSYRGKGIAKMLMEASLDIYKEADVDIATLEAISENEKAIKLYEKCGYDSIDRLVILQREGGFDHNPFLSENERGYELQHGIPADVIKLPFYQHMASWQTQWNSIMSGESLILKDANGEAAGYAIFTRAIEPSGNKAAVILQQCEASPDREEAKDIMRLMLSNIFAPFDWEGRRMTFNISEQNTNLVEILEAAGFSPLVRQVNMSRTMK